MFFSVLDLTLSNSAASKVVRYSTTSTPPCRQKEERKGGRPKSARRSSILSQNGGSGSRKATASSISHTSTCSADGAPRNWTRLATISVRYCLRPSTLASYSRVRSRPSTNTWRPFLRYSLQLTKCELADNHDSVPFDAPLAFALLVASSIVRLAEGAADRGGKVLTSSYTGSRCWRVTNDAAAKPHGPRSQTGSQTHQGTDGLSPRPPSTVRPYTPALFLM